MKAIVSTEIWNTSKGRVTKAVVRTADGKFLGPTNQTKGIPLKGKAPRPRISMVGR